MTDNGLEEIKLQLAHPYIRERKAALKRIEEEFLGQNKQVRACVELLQAIIEQNEYLIVSEEAKRILDSWHRKNQIFRTPDDRQHIFGVVCPKCSYQNYYDKRIVCRDNSVIVLVRADVHSNELLLECKNPNSKCDETFVVQVNCEGYR